MDSAIGSLGSPDDVFNERYQDFFDNLLSDSSSLAFAILASYINRLTPEMFRTIQQKIQTKLVDASRLSPSEGIMYFAWAVLRKHPKILTYNQGAYRTITWKALEFAFIQRFVKEDAVEDDSVFDVPFALFSTIYANEWKLITGSITVVSKKKPPYKQDSILDLPILNAYGNSKKSELLYFLWTLLENIIINSSKSFKINVEYVLKVLEISITVRRKIVTEKAFGTIVTIARAIKTNFAIYIDRIFYILQTSTIPSSIVYNFLINLLEELGPLADISKIYTTTVFKFANRMDKNGCEDASQSLEIIGRQEHSNELFNALRNDENDDDDEDFDALYDLVICVLEVIPTFIPVPYIKRIQMAICKRLLQSKTPSVKDLQLLNALLAIRNEKIPSPIQVARVIYSWSSIYKTPELAPYIKIGKALCDTQRSVRMNTFSLYKIETVDALDDVPMENGRSTVVDAPLEGSIKSTVDEPKKINNGTSNMINTDVAPLISLNDVDVPMETFKSADASMVNSKSPVDAPVATSKTPVDAPVATSKTPVDAPVVKNGTSAVNTVDDASKATSKSAEKTPIGGVRTSKKTTPTPAAKDDSDDDCMIIDEVNPTKTTKPLTPFPASRKRDTLKKEKDTPPAKKMNIDEANRAQLTVPAMLQDLFTS